MTRTKSKQNMNSGDRFFVAAPMSSFATEDEYVRFRKRVLNFCDYLASAPHTRNVFFAGTKIGKYADFEATSDALKTDADHIWTCNRFILLYPSKILSSALVEVGIAIGLKLAITIVCSKRTDLPYVLQSADSSASTHIEDLQVRTSNFSDTSLKDIADLVTRSNLCVAAE